MELVDSRWFMWVSLDQVVVWVGIDQGQGKQVAQLEDLVNLEGSEKF